MDETREQIIARGEQLIARMDEDPGKRTIRERNISTAEADYGQNGRPRSQMPTGTHRHWSSRFRRFVGRINERVRTNVEFARESAFYPRFWQRDNPSRRIRSQNGMSFAYLAGFAGRIILRNRNRERSDDGGGEGRDPKRKKSEDKDDKPRIHRLCQCPKPPEPGTQEFEQLFKKYIVDLTWDYLERNGQFHKYLQPEIAALGNIDDQDELIEKKYEIISTCNLTNEQRNNIRHSGKEKQQFSVSEILAIHLASDKCILEDVAQKQYATKLWVKELPFPIGSKGAPRNLRTNSKESLDQIYDCPNILLAFYLIHMIKSFQDDDLVAYAPWGGRVEHGVHWLNKSDIGSGQQNPSKKFYVAGVGEIFLVNRLSGLAHSVLNDYHTIISGGDPSKLSFERGRSIKRRKNTVKFGKDFMYNDLHTCHLLCPREEVLDKGTGANFCLNVNHVCCADGPAINNKAHEKCNGNVVCISRDGDDEVRWLFSFCTCGRVPGNPGGAICGHTQYVDVSTGASAIEQVVGGVHNYTSQQPITTNHGADSESFALISIGDDDGKEEEDDDEDDVSIYDQNHVPSHDLIDTGTSEIDVKKFHLVIFDTETSDKRIDTARILEIAFTSLVVDKKYSLSINPSEEFEISKEAFEVNGISKVQLIGKDDTVTGLTNFFGALKEVSDGCTLCLVGHNINKFDIPILEEEIQRYDKSNEIRRYLDNIYVIDTLEIAGDNDTWENLNMDTPPSKKLTDLHEYLLKKELVDSHSAIGDCLGNAKVLLKMDPTLKMANKYMKMWKEVRKVADKDDNEETE